MAQTRHRDQWGRLFEQKQREFLESNCLEALRISSFDELQIALEDMVRGYQTTPFPNFITRLRPSLEHLQNFNKAISSAAQADPHATLMWGAVQAIMESACQNQYAVEEMSTVVVTLNEALPVIDRYTDLITKSAKLQVLLQDLYDTYMDYCIASIQYIKRSGAANFLLYFIYSSPTKLLAKTKTSIIQQTKNLRKAIIEVEDEEKQHQAISKTLTTNPLFEVKHNQTDQSDGADQGLQFPVSTVIYYRNYTFLGREDIIRDMYTLFDPENAQTAPRDVQDTKHGSNAKVCILSGLGGIGKTQIALEYSYRYRGPYDAIFWVRAESSHTLSAGFVDICKALYMDRDLTDAQGQEAGRAVKRVNEWLSKTRRQWLLIFDNAESMDDLNPYYPFSTHATGHVIITTQRSDFFPVTDPRKTIVRQVKNLSRSEGAQIIFRYLQRDSTDEEERETACRISDLIDGLPLALATIGGYLNQIEGSVRDYYHNLEISSRAWEASAIGPAQQYEKNLETVFDHALRELPAGPRSLINMLAFLNPDAIPEAMFKRNIGTNRMPFLSSEAEFIDQIAILRRRQLVKRETSSDYSFISIHRTVQWSVILSLSKDNDHRWDVFNQTFELLKTCLPEHSSTDQPDPKNWVQYERYVPQLLQLRSHCLWPEPPVDLPVEFANVLSDMANYIWNAGLLGQGLEAMHTAENILDEHDISKKHPLRTRLHEHLGIIASFYGVSERDEAFTRRKKAMAARKAEFEKIPEKQRTLDDKIRRWNVESDMAFGHLQWEDFEACDKQLEKCLEQYQAWGSEDEIPFEYMKYHQCVCYVRISQGKASEAVEHAKKSAELSLQCAGKWHQMTYICRFALANMLYLADELEEALKESENVLEARLKICGEYNHWTLEAYAFRASLLAKNGKHEAAESLYQKCLDRRKWSYWNPEAIARTQFLYSQTLERLGKCHEAKAKLAQARKTKDYCLKHYPQWLENNETELVVFDQMVSIWAGRYTGKLRAVEQTAKSDNI